MPTGDDSFGLDVSNDPEVERLGANASVQHALQFWQELCVAARADALLFDPLWQEGDSHNDNHNGSGSSSSNCCQHTKELQFTDSVTKDQRLYNRFRSSFGPYWNVQTIASGSSRSAASRDDNGNDHENGNNRDDSMDVKSTLSSRVDDTSSSTVLSPLTGERWTALLLSCDGVVRDYNFLTLLRSDCRDAFWMTEDDACDGLLAVPRAQFVLIELARCREGYYARDFRRTLQLFDIKTASDDLESAVRAFLQSMTTATTSICNGETIEHNGTARVVAEADEVAAQRIRTALHNLATQWPHPTVRTLKVTRAVATLRRLLKSTASNGTTSSASTGASWIHAACLQQLERWRDLIQLGRLSRLVPRDEAAMLRRAAQALMHQSPIASTLVSDSNHKAQHHGQVQQHAKYVTQTTETLSDLMIATTNGSLFPSSENGGGDGSHAAKPSEIFDSFGLVLLPSYCSKAEVAACRQQGDVALQRLQDEQLTRRGLIVDGNAVFDFIEVRQRPGHRVDNRYTILDDASSPIASLGRKLVQDLSSRLFDDGDDGGNWRLLYAGIVHAFPGTSPDEPPPPQLWHRDGPSLFPGKDHHSTHCFNVFVPLVDIGVENGATEFVPGSHEDARYDAVSADVILGGPLDGNKEAGIIRADCLAGSVIVFDIRVIHRGLSNRSPTDRPMLYYTFCRDWFQEQHMFQKTESLLQDAPNSYDAHSAALCRELYCNVTGKEPPLMAEYGHPHYTCRFDLLLLEQFALATSTVNVSGSALTNDKNSYAMGLVNAVLRFSNATPEAKEAMCQKFMNALQSERSLARKRDLLDAGRAARKTQAANKIESESDFSSIQADMSDVAAFYQLSAQLLFVETPLLASLGFPPDEVSVTIALAALKSYCASSTTCCSVSAAQLEDCFSSWWNGAYSGCRFELVEGNGGGTKETGQKKLLVVFSSLGSGIARPEWFGTLKALGVPHMDELDVLHVMDFSFSWYCQDPLCQWNGTQYFKQELELRTKGYQSVCFLGDSMGASAALVFATLADTVLAFTPQVDISRYEAVTRADFSLTRRQEFMNDMIASVETSRADIAVHYGGQCDEDVRHVQLLPVTKHVSLVEHEFDDHVLSLHLRDKGKLTSIVGATLKKFMDNN